MTAHTHDREKAEQVYAAAMRLEMRVFGSRVAGNPLGYSDLDIAIVAEEDLDWRVLDSLRDPFSLSDLPITVDAVEWKALNPEFRNLIASDREVIQRPEQQR